MRTPIGRAASALPACLVALVLFAACTSDPALTSLPRIETVTTTALGDPALARVPGRLLILGPGGEITTMKPDGTDRVVLAASDPDIVERTQPTWSPDGTRVAWTERSADQEVRLVVAEADGETSITVPSPLMAVYIAWSPDGSRFAVTGTDDEGSLLLAIAEPDGSISVVDEGAPLYFDWARDGESLLVRVEGRFEHLALDGSERVPVVASGTFRIGVHLGESLVLATSRDVGDALAVAGSDGAIQRELIRYGGPIAYVVGPDDDKLAVMTRGSPESQQLARLEETDLAILEPDRLVSIDTANGDIAEVRQGRGVAWFWSPDGGLLLYSTLEFVDGVERLRWHIWDGEDSTSYQPFSPTGVFGRDYLAYFDQFARSISLWAPDGSAFVYAGGTSLDDAGIWVQPVAGGDPIRVSGGEMALWSPDS